MKKISFVSKRSVVKLGVSLIAVVFVAGCAMFGINNNHRQASSVMEYLYPAHADSHVDTPTVPVLSLPLKVGVAFVPEHSNNRGGNFGSWENGQFTEKQKMALMKEVSDSFKNFSYVQSIELIPSTYLTPQGGFENLDQLRSMFAWM